MLKNYFFVVLRHFQKQKMPVIVNIIGLTIAITACLFILLFVSDELQYDDFHVDKERIFRYIVHINQTGDKNAIFPAVEFPTIKEAVPGIEEGFRLRKRPGQQVNISDKKFLDDIYFADKEILDIFTFPLVLGDNKKALEAPFSVVIDEDIAKRYFGDENPVGKTLKMENNYDFNITGVLKNIPGHSHIKPGIIASISTLNVIEPSTMTQRSNSSCYFYFLLKKNVTRQTVEEKLNLFLKENYGEDIAKQIRIILEPLNEIYLYSYDTKWDIAEHGDIDTVKVFVIIAFLIMAMASFNFTNLYSAGIKIRQKEYAIRKLLGAQKRQTIKQFLFETFCYLFISLALSVVMVELLLSKFNQITEKKLGVFSLLQWEIILPILGLMLVTAIFSILYPAYVNYKTDSINNLKGKSSLSDLKLSKFTLGFRQVVTTIQLAITVALIFATVIIYRQMSYASNARLGFSKDQLLVVRNPWGEKMYQHYQQFRNMISGYTAVQSVSASANLPGENINNYTFVRKRGQSEQENIQCAQIAVDYGIFKTMQVKLLNGRDFSEHISSDYENAVIINKAAAEKLGLENPVGERLEGINNTADAQEVIGVVENIHFKSFKEEVLPIIFYVRNWGANNIVIKLNTDNLMMTMKSLQKDWESIFPDRIFHYSFVDDTFNELYKSEKRTETLIFVFCTLAIVISFVGLLSLITLVLQMRRKEIGIRKVLGASVKNIIASISTEYFFIITIAYIISFPVAYYFLSKWLERFVYRIDITWWMFVLSGGVALLIALATVSFQAIKAATANPVESLRYE